VNSKLLAGSERPLNWPLSAASCLSPSLPCEVRGGVRHRVCLVTMRAGIPFGINTYGTYSPDKEQVTISERVLASARQIATTCLLPTCHRCSSSSSASVRPSIKEQVILRPRRSASLVENSQRTGLLKLVEQSKIAPLEPALGTDHSVHGDLRSAVCPRSCLLYLGTLYDRRRRPRKSVARGRVHHPLVELAWARGASACTYTICHRDAQSQSKLGA
jgi:hypothetical protein